MKFSKDTLAQAKAWSHGYCWPYRQWGNHSAGNDWDMSYPLSFTVECFVVVANDMSSYDKSFQYIGIQNLQKDKFHMYTSGSADLQIGYIAIGK